jgi:hypothetical protein
VTLSTVRLAHELLAVIVAVFDFVSVLFYSIIKSAILSHRAAYAARKAGK